MNFLNIFQQFITFLFAVLASIGWWKPPLKQPCREGFLGQNCEIGTKYNFLINIKIFLQKL